MKTACLLLIGFLMTASVVGVAKDRSFYDIKANIIPQSGQLEVALVLDYVHPSEETDSVAFLLHQNLVIESLTGPKIKQFAYRDTQANEYPFNPEARLVILVLETPLMAGEHLQITMKYAGAIGIVGEWETNRITEDWIELGNYAPWFPYHPGSDEIGFEIELSIAPPYMVAANGRTTGEGGIWRILADTSDNDIVLAASRNIESREHENGDLSFAVSWATDLDDATVEDILNVGMAILDRYTAWFGQIDTGHGAILISSREKGGGYARKNLIVLSAIRGEDYFDKKTGYIRYLAHELAHHWWHRAEADTWHDWLNESFAEYSALMIIRELAGWEEFANRLGAKRDRIANLPPLRDLDRSDENAYSVLYDKGPVLLHGLEEQLGQAEFIRLLKAAFDSEISSTEQFLSLLEIEGGPEILEYFKPRLDM